MYIRVRIAERLCLLHGHCQLLENLRFGTMWPGSDKFAAIFLFLVFRACCTAPLTAPTAPSELGSAKQAECSANDGKHWYYIDIIVECTRE